jgi:hypothetical protein
MFIDGAWLQLLCGRDRADALQAPTSFYQADQSRQISFAYALSKFYKSKEHTQS